MIIGLPTQRIPKTPQAESCQEDRNAVAILRDWLGPLLLVCRRHFLALPFHIILLPRTQEANVEANTKETVFLAQNSIVLGGVGSQRTLNLELGEKDRKRTSIRSVEGEP